MTRFFLREIVLGGCAKVITCSKECRHLDPDDLRDRCNRIGVDHGTVGNVPSVGSIGPRNIECRRGGPTVRLLTVVTRLPCFV